MSELSGFEHVPAGPPNVVFDLLARCQADPNPDKINLGIGAYKTEEGTGYVLNIVKKVEQKLLDDPSLDKEYLPIKGDAEFVKLCQKLILGQNSSVIKENRICGVQTISGTGAIRIIAEFISEWLPNVPIFMSNPTWENHSAIFRRARINSKSYRYWKEEIRRLDIDGMVEDIMTAPKGSVILLHACAHNPTGVDPTRDEWKLILESMKKRNHFAFFDSAYQGFATGDLDNDAWAVRYFAEQGFEMFIAQSFSKNLGLYGERVGCASFICANAAVVPAVASQVALLIRPMYSNPPKHGMYIAKKIMGDPDLFSEWCQELKLMSGRVKTMRSALFDELSKLSTPSPSGDWKHIVTQIGMFSFTGLSADQVDVMVNKHHVYMFRNGRISLAGLTRSRAPYLARAIHHVVTTVGSNTPSA